MSAWKPLIKKLLFPSTISGRFLQVLLAVFGVLLYAEVIHHLVVVGLFCRWPDLPGDQGDTSETIRVFITADPHILGHRFGHWFDRLRREWAMQRSYHAAYNMIRPAADATFVLGDLTDEGEFSQSAEEMAEYKRRFDLIFNPNSLCPVISLVGNHDVGFHYKFHPDRMKVFDSKFVGDRPEPASSVRLVQLGSIDFVLLNSMAFEADAHCELCEEAQKSVDQLSKKLSKSRPFLFQHFPLFRESDRLCPESPHSAPDPERTAMMRPKMDCLSAEATSMLLSKFKPRLVVSGHTHYSCNISHRSPNGGRRVNEISVPSFSWRNNKAPAMLLLVADAKKRHAVAICALADEQTVINFYIVSGSLLFVLCILRPILCAIMGLCIKRHGKSAVTSDLYAFGEQKVKKV